jgi:hypothetical protein
METMKRDVSARKPVGAVVTTFVFLLQVCVVALVPAIASAGEPAVNTGLTSFMDGFGDPRGSGFVYSQFARLSVANSMKDGQGNDVPFFQDPRLMSVASLNQFIYSFKTDGWLVHPGVYTILPLIYLDASAGAAGMPLQDNGFGLGDMFFGAFLQFNPAMSTQGPFFAHRFEFTTLAPTGKYDSSKQLNPGANAWSLNPSWVATLLPLRFLEITARLNYLYNLRNTDPGLGMDSTQAGQAVFCNFAVAGAILPWNPQRTAAHDLRAGVNGYYFKQITDSKANGVAQPGSREQIVAIGPGAMWTPTSRDIFWLNMYIELAAKNRMPSQVVQLRWAHMF